MEGQDTSQENKGAAPDEQMRPPHQPGGSEGRDKEAVGPKDGQLSIPEKTGRVHA